MTGIVGPLDDQFLLALGRVTANFAVLEDSVSFFLWSLIGRDQRLGQIITAELSFKATRALLSAIFQHRIVDQVLRDELESLLNRISENEERRNVLVHSSWAAGDTPETRTRIKMTAKKGKGIRHQFEQLVPADIEVVAARASELALDVHKFTDKLPDELIGRVRITM